VLYASLKNKICNIMEEKKTQKGFLMGFVNRFVTGQPVLFSCGQTTSNGCNLNTYFNGK
jgi:hypothetical protein